MARETKPGQMTLDVGSAYGDEEIIRGTLGISGRIPTDYELDLDDTVTVTIADADGNVIASGTATADRATPIPHRKDVPWIERRQRVNFDAEQEG